MGMLPALWTLVALALPSDAHVTALSIETAIQTATLQHPKLAAADADLALLRARAEQAWAAYLPSLTGGIAFEPQTTHFAPSPAYNRELARRIPSGQAGVIDALGNTILVSCIPPLGADGRPDYSVCHRFSSGTAQGDDITGYWTASVGLSWTAFDWGQTTYAHQAAIKDVAAQKLAMEAIRADIALATKLAYYGVLAAQAGAAVAEEALAAQKRHLEQTRIFVQHGIRTKADNLLAEADVANAELTLAQAKGAVQAAWGALSAALGDKVRTEYQLVSALPDADSIEFDEPNLIAAVAARPELRALALQVEGQEDRARAVRGAYLPRLIVSLGVDWSGESLSSLTNNFTASIGLVFGASARSGMNPFAVSADRKEVEAKAAAVRAKRIETENEFRLQSAQVLANLSSARQSLISARRRLEATAARRDLVLGQFRSGIGSLLELSDAELAFVNARFQEVRVTLQVAQLRAVLDRVLGR